MGREKKVKTTISVFLALLCGVISALAQNGNGQSTTKYPNDPLVGSQWYLDSIGVKQTWTPSSGLASAFTSTVKVVVMDSGIAPVSELFQNLDTANSRTFFGKQLPTEDTSTKGFMTQYPYGHGTLVAGIIGAVGNNSVGIAGINWHADLVSYKVYSTVDIYNKTVLTTALDSILKAFEALRDLPGNLVVNCSFAMPYTDEIGLWKTAIAALGDKVLIVAGAGNDGNTTPLYPCAFGLPNVLCVGSTDQDGKLSQFSNHGEDWVDAAAPGEGILTTANDGSFQSVSGTSFDTPMVSGGASLLWQGKPLLKSSELKQAILSGASFNPLLVGLIAGARQFNLQGSINALEKLTSGTNAVSSPQVSLLGLGSAWTDQPGLAWGGLASAYGDNFTDGAEFFSVTPVTRLGNISILIGTIPMMLTYVGPHQKNFHLPMDNWQFSQGGNTISVVKYDDNGNVISWSAIQGVRPVTYNPGFLTGPDGKLFLDTLDGETVLYATGLGFTDPWIKAGTVGKGTEKVQAKVQIILDDQIVTCTATASSRWAGVYEVRISTPPTNAATLTVKVGDWQKQFILK